ncbi:MAG: hypothetical protein LBC64_03300 [Fibromonadaceae bacterium]|jgi:hypothetical protein|nr:hypothetical protein [Fibromonadaceae bacterium]
MFCIEATKVMLPAMRITRKKTIEKTNNLRFIEVLFAIMIYSYFSLPEPWVAMSCSGREPQPK